MSRSGVTKLNGKKLIIIVSVSRLCVNSSNNEVPAEDAREL